MNTKMEVYAFTDDDGNERWLDVVSMRRRAEESLELIRIAIDMRRVEELFSSEAINQEHLRNQTMTGNPKPILICLELVKEDYQIGDGNHTYVAAAVAAELGRNMGLHDEQQASVEGWALTPKQWQPFLISRQMQSDLIKDHH